MQYECITEVYKYLTESYSNLKERQTVLNESWEDLKILKMNIEEL